MRKDIKPALQTRGDRHQRHKEEANAMLKKYVGDSVHTLFYVPDTYGLIWQGDDRHAYYFSCQFIY